MTVDHVIGTETVTPRPARSEREQERWQIMCGRRSNAAVVAGGAGLAVAARPEQSSCRWFGRSLGSGVDAATPRQQIAHAVSVLVPATAGAFFIFAVVPSVSWVVSAFGWMMFPAVGLLARGIAGIARGSMAAGPTSPPLGSATAGQETAVAVARRLRSLAITIAEARPEAGPGLERLMQATDRLATTAADITRHDTATERWVSERWIQPTLLMLERYARLADQPADALGDALREIEGDGLFAVATKLDRVRQGFDQPGLRPDLVA